MEANAKAGANVHPGTKDEVLALRKAGGASLSGYTNSTQLRDGMLHRYGYLAEFDQTAARVLPMLVAGTGCVLFGHLSNFGYFHRLRRGDRSYTGGHIVYIQCEGQGAWWWIDPLIKPSPDYTGEWVSTAELQTFMRLQDADTGLYTTLPQTGDSMAVYAPAKRYSYTLRISPGTSVYQEPSLASQRIGIKADSQRYEVRSLAVPLPTPAGQPPAFGWANIVGLKADGVTPDISGPTLAGWVQADPNDAVTFVLREPQEIVLAGGDATLAGRQFEWDRQRAGATVQLLPKP